MCLHVCVHGCVRTSVFHLCALDSLAAHGCFLINAPLSCSSYKKRERAREKWDEGVVCIDLIVPFEGSAVSRFWVNTRAWRMFWAGLTKRTM